jgi:hypothetical protein
MGNCFISKDTIPRERCALNGNIAGMNTTLYFDIDGNSKMGVGDVACMLVREGKLELSVHPAMIRMAFPRLVPVVRSIRPSCEWIIPIARFA